MNENWWPDLLRYIPDERPWDAPNVVVAELRSYPDDPIFSGSRSTTCTLISLEDLAALDGKLIGFNYEVETSGPGPSEYSAGDYKPEFWISALTDDRRIKTEPIVLSWDSTQRTAMMVEPGFLMTYGLIPRALADGSMHWDDLSVPEFGIAVVDAPSIYSDCAHSGARVTIERDHLQDYLTLRGMALVQVYYESRYGWEDEAAEAVLADRQNWGFKFSDRELDVRRREGGGYIAQVWGARVIARPRDLPVTRDALKTQGLTWPGFPKPITQQTAGQYFHEYMYFRDTVLGAYEGQPGFRVDALTGSVSYGHQWGMGPAIRIGRDHIRIEVRKVYEAPTRAVQHWHAFAIEPTPDLLDPSARKARNIGVRSHALVYAMADLGGRLGYLSQRIGLEDIASAHLVGVDRVTLDYEGWWNAPHVEPITRHVPLNLDRSAFLDRCVALAKIVVEVLAQRHLRRIVTAIGTQPDKMDTFGGLKLLDRIVCLSQLANDSGLTLWQSGDELTRRLASDGTNPARPLDRLFALNDLRQAGAHRKDEIVEEALRRFGIDVR